MIKLISSKKQTWSDDSEWERKQIELAKKDSKFFAPLYDKYYKRIFLYIRKRINRVEDAEDIASLAFEKAVKNLKKFQWQGISLSAWLYRIARNAMNDYLRKIQGKKDISGMDEIIEITSDEEPTQMENVIRDEMQEELLQAIAKLKKQDQLMVYYKFFEGMSNKKIAIELEMSETNVGTKLHRIKEKLRKLV